MPPPRAASLQRKRFHESRIRKAKEGENDGNNVDDESGDDDDTEVSNTKKSKSTADKKLDQDEPVWVQCNTCDKWRALPCTVDVNSLPDIWTCDQNIYDLERNNCEAAEETYKQTDAQLKSFLKLWVKRIRNADRAEVRLPPSAVTRGRKKKSETEWIKCCNPGCGKWRAILGSVDSSNMLKKLNDNKWGRKDALWFCSMNSWDETTASCAAPQEPLYDCTWNLGLDV